MPEKIVTFVIDGNGDFTIDMAGFHGKGCKDVAKAFEPIGKVTNEVEKPEYHAGPGQGNYLSTGR
jgi:hypothetical protein